MWYNLELLSSFTRFSSSQIIIVGLEKKNCPSPLFQAAHFQQYVNAAAEHVLPSDCGLRFCASVCGGAIPSIKYICVFTIYKPKHFDIYRIGSNGINIKLIFFKHWHWFMRKIITIKILLQSVSWSLDENIGDKHSRHGNSIDAD